MSKTVTISVADFEKILRKIQRLEGAVFGVGSSAKTESTPKKLQKEVMAGIKNRQQKLLKKVA